MYSEELLTAEVAKSSPRDRREEPLGAKLRADG
jgi:hypothetical protein